MKNTRQNILAYSAKHLEQLGPLRPLEYIALDLDCGCDFDCIDCCNDRSLPRDIKKLSLEEINGLLDEAKDLGARVLVFMGVKEPTLDPRFKRIVQLGYEKEMAPYVFSNGGLGLNDDMILFLHDHNASLVVQLKSLQEDVFEEHNRVPGSFRPFMKHMENLRKVFLDSYDQINEYGLRRVATNTVVDDSNKHELSQIRDFCGDDFVAVFNTEMEIGAAKDNPDIRVTPEITRTIKTVTPDMIPLGTTSDGSYCAYMRNGLAILEGEVLLCPYSLESAGKLGRVKRLKDLIGIANAKVQWFYAGKPPRCILRDERYNKLIESLE